MSCRARHPLNCRLRNVLPFVLELADDPGSRADIGEDQAVSVVLIRIFPVVHLPLGHSSYVLKERHQVKVEVYFLKLSAFYTVHERHGKLF
jgi:hypothetical protein